MLRLQQYERLLKALAAHQQLEGPVGKLESLQAEKVAKQAKQTLGGLVTQLTSSYLSVTGEQAGGKDLDASDPDVGQIGWMSLRFRMELPEAEHSRIVQELSELVLLRNELVHHLIEKFDVWSVAGCKKAIDHLMCSYDLIDHHYKSLVSWAQAMEQSRALTSSFLNSHEFLDAFLEQPDEA